jgi:dTDP-4-amino-4,6-dideoxygalactose transaminase
MTATSHYIPLAVPEIGEEEIEAAAEALRSGWVTSGGRVAGFEREFRASVGARHALAVNSCTSGLHLALKALGVGPGDEVITTSMTFCATVNVILETGASPVVVDIGPDLNLDLDAAKAALNGKTRAIVPVHIAGLPCRMSAVWELARKHDLHVIEDAAHAAGASCEGIPTGGGPSDATAFSFYATKNMTTGEGGMVVTPSAGLDAQMRILALHGISRDAWSRYEENGSWYYEVVERGFKYNMSDIQAAIGRAQLRKLERMNARRAEVAARYSEAFADLEEVELAPDRAGCRHAWHLYILRLNLDMLRIDRAGFIEEMRARGIGCSVHFIPIPLHRYYQRVLPMRDPCERALREYPRLVSLPLYSKMTEEDTQRVIEAVRGIVESNRKVREVGVCADACKATD